MQGIVLLLKGLELQRLLQLCAEGGPEPQSTLSPAAAAELDTCLHEWLPAAQPAAGPIFLAAAAAGLLCQSLCPGQRCPLSFQTRQLIAYCHTQPLTNCPISLHNALQTSRPA